MFLNGNRQRMTGRLMMVTELGPLAKDNPYVTFSGQPGHSLRLDYDMQVNISFSCTPVYPGACAGDAAAA